MGYYIPGTFVTKPTYQDPGSLATNTNPIALDSRGQAIVWGSGTYRQIVKDVLGATIWDRAVSSGVGSDELAGAGGAALVGYGSGTLAQYLSTLTATVPSIAALRAISKVSSQEAFVLGYYASGDGGGGQYWYDPSDTSSSDNGGTVIIAIDGGRWKMILLGCASIKQFGAKGDGVTDDTASIQAALNFGSCTAPAGVFIVTRTISMMHSFYGSGDYSTTLLCQGDFDALILAANGVGIEGVKLDSVAQRSAGAFVKIATALRNNFVRHSSLNNAFIGIHLDAECVITYIEDVCVLNTAPNGYGIWINGGNDTFLTHVIMDANAMAQPKCGVRITRSQATWMTDCDIIHQGNGIQIDPDASQNGYITWCFFENVACDLGSSEGLFIGPKNGATIKGLFFTNCWFSSNFRGVNILSDATSAVDGIFFTSCTFFNNRGQGAIVQAGHNIEFNLCRVSGNSQATPGSVAGIHIIAGISDFAVRGTRSGAIAGFAVTQSYGLLIDANCNGYTVTDNNFLGNNTSPALDLSAVTSGTREVFGNLGFKTRNSGVARINAATNQSTVLHGLATIPKTVMLTAADSNINGLSFWAGSFSATAFNINVSSNLATSGVFSWVADAY